MHSTLTWLYCCLIQFDTIQVVAQLLDYYLGLQGKHANVMLDTSGADPETPFIKQQTMQQAIHSFTHSPQQRNYITQLAHEILGMLLLTHTHTHTLPRKHPQVTQGLLLWRGCGVWSMLTSGVCTRLVGSAAYRY